MLNSKNYELVDEINKLIAEQDECKLVCEQINEVFGKIFKIKRIYAKPKGSRNTYYSMTYEKDMRG